MIVKINVIHSEDDYQGDAMFERNDRLGNGDCTLRRSHVTNYLGSEHER